MHMVSVVIVNPFMLVGDGSVLYVEARKKVVRLAVVANKEAQERSC